MTTAFVSWLRRSTLLFHVLVPLLFLALLPGCKREKLSDAERADRKKQERANVLGDQGATVMSKKFGPFGTGYMVNLSGAQLTDRTFQALKDLTRVAELDLSKSSLTDDQMDQLNEAALFLVKLDLSNTAVTDAGLEKLTNLNKCIQLNLAGTRVTRAGAARFREKHKGPNKKATLQIQM